MKRRKFTSKAEPATLHFSLPDLFPLAPANRAWFSEDDCHLADYVKELYLRWLNTVSARSAVLCKSQRGFSKAKQIVKYV